MKVTSLLLALSAAAAFGQTPTVAAVVNVASFGTQLCPGLIATVYGTNFGTNAAAVSVSVGGKAAYVYSPVVATQINVQIPFEASVGATALTVSVGGAQSAPFNITLSAVSPYFLTAGGTGTGIALVYNASAGNAQVTAAAPAHAGDSLVVNAVGLGPTNPPTASTANGLAPATAPTAATPTVTVGGANATVAFAGVVSGGYSGIYQVNFAVPAGVSGTVPLVITIGGVSSATLGVNSASVTLPVVSTLSAPTITGVQNGASYGTQLCPGVQAIVYGTGFGTTAANLSVTVGGKAAYVIGPFTTNQMLIQIPFEASVGAATMTVTVGGVASAPFNITLSAVAPALLIQGSAPTGPASVVENSSGTVVTSAAPAHTGDAVYLYATGLGPTSPPTATGPVSANNPAATLPSLTVGGVSAKVSSAVTTGYVGVFQVNFTVPANVQGTQPLVLSTGGSSTSPADTIALAGTSYVISNATFANPGVVSPGSIATLFANAIGTTSNQTTIFPATTAEGVHVTFNGIAAPLFHVIGAGAQPQIDLLVPSELPTSGTVNVVLTTSSATYANYSLTMAPSNPGFYRIADPKVTTRENVIAQFNGTAGLALPVSTTAALGLPACTSTTSALSVCGRPAIIGDYLVLYATGLGLTTPGGDPNGKPLATGAIPPIDASVLYETPTTPVVTIGGISTKVLFSGLTPGYPGEYEVVVQVPSGVATGDDIPVSVAILGASDSSTTISIQPKSN
jgi:uncharacterized protein (TIGR03437 family)